MLWKTELQYFWNLKWKMQGAGVWAYMAHSDSLTNMLLWLLIHPCRARCPAHRGAGCWVLGRSMKSLVEQKKAARSWPLWAQWAGCGDKDEQQECCGVGLVEICSDELCCFWSQLQALSAGWGRVSPPGLSVSGSDAFCSTQEENKPEFLICGAVVAFFTMSFFTSWWILGRQVWSSDSFSPCHAQRFPRRAGYQHKVQIYKL